MKKFKTCILAVLSAMLMVSILATSVSAVQSYFGLNNGRFTTGIAFLEPSTYASCKASTVQDRNYTGNVYPSKQSVLLTARFSSGETITEGPKVTYATGNVAPDAAVSVVSAYGSKFVSATSTHTQTVGGTTYRKDLSA